MVKGCRAGRFDPSPWSPALRRPRRRAGGSRSLVRRLGQGSVSAVPRPPPGRGGGMSTASHLLPIEAARRWCGRERGRVETAVGVGVADHGKEAWVGQRELDGMVFTSQRCPESREIGLPHLEPTPIEIGQRGLAPHEMERGALLRARLCQKKRAVLEVEGCQVHLSGELDTDSPPVKPARDHEMDYYIYIVVEPQRDPLPKAP